MIEQPLIQQPLLVGAVIVAVTALAFWLDEAVPALSKVGASLLAIVFGALLSNFRVVPAASPVYDAIAGPITSLAIVWLLLSVSLDDVRRAGPRMLAAFALAGLGTMLGAMVGALAYGGFFGVDTWRLAGTLTGTYTGGSLNFVAVSRGLELPQRLFAGATAADALSTSLWLGATLMLPLWLARFFPTPVPAHAAPSSGGAAAVDGGAAADHATSGTATTGASGGHAHPFFYREPTSTLDLAVLVAAGFVLLVAADALAAWIPGVPSVLWLTTLALVAGHVGPLKNVPGGMQLGTLALHFFFVVIGIFSLISEIAEVGIEVFYYTLVVVLVHGAVVYGGGRLARLDVGTLSVASQAAVGGPSSALAVAVSREWPALVLPGVAVGLLGYALGNYLGFGVGYLVRALGIGL